MGPENTRRRVVQVTVILSVALVFALPVGVVGAAREPSLVVVPEARMLLGAVPSPVLSSNQRSSTGVPGAPALERSTRSSCSPAPCVQSTLVLFNNTLNNGTFLANDGGTYAQTPTYDPSTGDLWVMDWGGDSISIVSNATREVSQMIATGGGTEAAAYDSKQNEMWVAVASGVGGDGWVDVYNATTAALITSLTTEVEPSAVAYDSGNGEVYVANVNSDDVEVFDASTQSEVKMITTPGYPEFLTYDSGMAEVFVACGPTNVSIIADGNNSIVKTISVGQGVSDLVYDSAKGEVFVANYENDVVSVISDSTNGVVATVDDVPAEYLAYDATQGEISVGGNGVDKVSFISDGNNSVVGSLALDDAPSGMTYVPLTGDLFVSCLLCVQVSSEASRTLLSVIPLASQPSDVVYDSGRGEVFVSDTWASRLDAINSSTSRIVGSLVNIPSPMTLTYDGRVGEIFVAYHVSSSNFVGVVSDSKVSFVANVSLGFLPAGLACDSSNGEVFALDSSNGSVAVISDSSNTVVAWIHVGPEPYAAAYDSSKGEIFVVNVQGDNVSVINATTNRVSATVPVGWAPDGIVYDSDKGEVWVATQERRDPGNLTAISDTNNTVVANVREGNQPIGLAFDAAEGDVYAVDPGGENLTTVSDATNSVLAVTDLGEDPLATAFDTVTNEAYVANEASGTLSIINAGIPPLAVQQFEASPGTIDLGQTSTLDAQVVGGYGPYTFSYTGLPRGCASENVSTFACTPTGEGNFTVTVRVQDAHGTIATGTLSLDVNQSLTTFTVSPSGTVSLAFGGPQGFTASALNSTGVVIRSASITWALSPSFLGVLSAASGTASTLTAGSTPGQGRLWANASYGGTSKSLMVAIHVSETKGPSITSFSAVPSSVPVGMTTNITTSASGDGLTYAYGGLPPGCTSASVPTLPCSPTAAGSYNVDVNVTDSNGLTVEANTTLTVTPPSASEELASVAVSPAGPVTLNTASPDLFTATPENSTGHPLSVVVAYHWSFSPSTLGTLNSTSGRIVQFTSGGTAESGTLWVNVTFAGVSKSASVTIAVESKTTGSGTEGPTYFGLSEFDFVSLIVAIMAVVVGIIPVILELRKRENRREARKEEERKEEAAAAAGPAEGTGGSEVRPSPPPSPSPSPPTGSGDHTTTSKSSTASTSMPDADLAFVMGGPAVAVAPPSVAPAAPEGPTPSANMEAPAPASSSETKACIMCGKQIPKRARFCGFCNEAQD